MEDYLYHYTSIDTLALILKSKKIRFNRLDNVDDLSECESVEGKHIGRRLFVSCWTKDSKENIPLWKMYAGLDGVRVKLPVKWYKEYRIEGSYGEKKRFFHGSLYMDISLPYSGPIEPQKLISDTYSIMPSFAPSSFPIEIEYTDNESKLIPRTTFKEGGKTKIGLDHIGKYKSTYWLFQKEYRYILYIIPLKQPNTVNAPIHEVFPTEISSNEYPINEYYIDISDEALSSMEVVMGPACNESKELILRALLEKYAPNSTLSTSVLKGTLNIK